MTFIDVGVMRDMPDGTVTLTGDTTDGQGFTMHAQWPTAIDLAAAILVAASHAAGMAGHDPHCVIITLARAMNEAMEAANYGD